VLSVYGRSVITLGDTIWQAGFWSFGESHAIEKPPTPSSAKLSYT